MSEERTLRIATYIATVLGVGRSPAAPGTAGSVVALPFAWLIATFGGRFALMLAVILVLGLGAWACEIYARANGREDPSECVIDEVAGQWIICAFAPLSIAAYFVAFILFRVFDIVKPWPVRLVERRVPGGLGIMADDVVAALMGSIIMVLLGHLGVF
ncbi:MAG TPA: phosphatidylglycerophosphatase A [Rhizomicrobium sp.]|nr:phosphatidylglycerophosphatase A [Rhizomicrobium sp.]